MRPRALPLVALLAALPLSGLSAQTLNVVASRGFRPTAVLLPHTRFVVAADSGDEGVVVIKELSVPPVTFAGSIRIEGVQPGARAPEHHAFPDSVRFESDGRVRMLVGDAAGRPPMTVEVTGARGAPAGRINIAAPGFPLGRVLLVTVAPADIYELAWRATGYGVRDRIRVDDRVGFAFLSDSSAGPTTVAIGFGRDTHGRIQSDVASVVLERDFGGQTGRERRAVGALTLITDPGREDNATAQAEIVFGVGNSEAEALRAARAASDEPTAAPRAAALQVRTPSAEANLLLAHLLAVSGWMLDWDVPGGERTIPSSAVRPAVRAEDAWAAAPLALQRGDTAAVCGSYRLLRGNGRSRVEVATRLGSRGRYLAAADSTNASADAAAVLLAHACYAATRDTTLLRRDFAALSGAALRAAHGESGDLGAEAVERLAELDDEMTRLTPGRAGSGDSLRGEAARLAGRASMPPAGALWRSIVAEAQRGIQQDYGRLSSAGGAGGASLAAGGSFVSLLGNDLFGVSEYLDRIEIAPQLDGIADDFTWQLDNWLLGGGEALALTYRPSARAAQIRVTAAQHHRIALRFPWLSAGSCVTARRGPDTPERLALVALSDGAFYVDVRGAFEPAVLTVSAGSCGPG